MEFCYDGALVMPSNFVVVENDEMEYVDGGGSYSVSPIYLSRTACSVFGVAHSLSEWMLPQRIAIEMFAHAVLYYASSALYATIGKLVGTSQLAWIKSHSNPIDLGGDSAARIAAFTAIWLISPSIL
jgi:hypothetical protein